MLGLRGINITASPKHHVGGGCRGDRHRFDMALQDQFGHGGGPTRSGPDLTPPLEQAADQGHLRTR